MYTNNPQPTQQPTPQANRGGGSSAPTNHYSSNLSPYHQSPTPPAQYSPFGGSSSSSQMQLNFGASMQEQHHHHQHNTFNQQIGQQLPIGQGGGDQSLELAAEKVRAVNPNLVAPFLELCQIINLDAFCVAIHFSPDPTKAGKDEKKNSLNKSAGFYNSPDGWKWDISNNIDFTMNYQADTTKQPSTYDQVFDDGEKLKPFLKNFNKNIRWKASNGDIYDLRKLFDPTGGVTIKYTPIKRGPTYIVGWKDMKGQEMRLARDNPARLGNQIARLLACRANILTFCEEKGLPLLPPQSQVQLPTQPSYQFPPVVNPPFSQVPPPAAAAAVPEVPLSPVPPQVSPVPVRASTAQASGDNTELLGLRTEFLGYLSGAAKCIKDQSELSNQQSKDMGKLIKAVGAMNVRQDGLEHNQRELWNNQQNDRKIQNRFQVYQLQTNEGVNSRLEALELENALRNGGGAVSSPAPPPNASATASAVDAEMADSSSPAPAPVPQVFASQPAPSADQEMDDSAPSNEVPSDASKKMPSGAGAATPQASAVTSNEAASSPFASVSASSSVQAVTSPKKISATCSSHIKTTTPTKPTFNFGSPSNEAASSSPFASVSASSSVPVVASPKKISASCSSGAKTTTPTEPTFNMGFTPPKEKPNPKNKIKGRKNTTRRSPKATSRSPSASSSSKKKANVMRNNLVAEKRKKTAAPSPVKNPASDISKSVTTKASNSAPVARRYGTQLVNGAVRDWDDSKHWTRIFCALELMAVAGSAFKYDNVSQYCAELTSGLPNNFQKVAVLFQNVVVTDSYEKLVNEYITGLKTFRCGSEERFEEEIKKGIDIAKLKGGM